jgi:hypothetical protein
MTTIHYQNPNGYEIAENIQRTTDDVLQVEEVRLSAMGKVEIPHCAGSAQ